MSKHTRGPWAKDRHGQLRSPDGKQVVVWGAGIAWGNRDAETEANGKLLAAAPELLSALKAMLPEANRLDEHLRPTFETCEAARAVIAKAEGRS